MRHFIKFLYSSKMNLKINSRARKVPITLLANKNASKSIHYYQINLPKSCQPNYWLRGPGQLNQARLNLDAIQLVDQTLAKPDPHRSRIRPHLPYSKQAQNICPTRAACPHRTDGLCLFVTGQTRADT